MREAKAKNWAQLRKPRRRRDEEGREFNELRKIGFEFKAPVDTYSMQPDSSSTIDGIRGEQEYGIAGGVSTEPGQSPETIPHEESRVLSEDDMSEWTMEHAGETEEYLEEEEREHSPDAPSVPPEQRERSRHARHHHQHSRP